MELISPSQELSTHSTITRCRIGGGENLTQILDLGCQALSGVFPQQADQAVTTGPLELVWSPESGLVQLRQSYDTREMFGDNYGYRSGLNISMVQHLQQKVRELVQLKPLSAGDVVLDIGSNDATLLNAYSVPGLRRIGIDPTGSKFARFYQDGIELVPDFFSPAAFRSRYPEQKAQIITSIAMFYDLEDPVEFMEGIFDVLADEGIWHFEQSYLPTMLRNIAYDTVCHEHREYYSLAVVKTLLERCGLRLIDVQTNSINGGSFAVTAAKKSAPFTPNHAVIDWLLAEEERMGLNTEVPYRLFAQKVVQQRESLRALVHDLIADGRRIAGYGASTKGNVLLQYCGFGPDELCCIADVNPDKYGSFTPGTGIPIVSEAEAKAMEPDYFLVLPWHFRPQILAREHEFRTSGGRFIFPLPEIEIV